MLGIKRETNTDIHVDRICTNNLSQYEVPMIELWPLDDNIVEYNDCLELNSKPTIVKMLLWMECPGLILYLSKGYLNYRRANHSTVMAMKLGGNSSFTSVKSEYTGTPYQNHVCQHLDNLLHTVCIMKYRRRLYCLFLLVMRKLRSRYMCFISIFVRCAQYILSLESE